MATDRAPATAASGPILTKFGNKKRVRRIQRELTHFKQQAQELELRLKGLKLRRSSPRVSVWTSVAEGLLKERLRAERQHGELLKSHAQLVQVSTELRALLHKYQNHLVERSADPEAARRRLRFWDLTAMAVDELFSQQLTEVAALRLQLQQCQKPSRTLYVDAGLTRGETLVKRDPTTDAGIRLEKHFVTTVPFSLNVAAKAYWRFFQMEHGDRHAASHAPDFLTDVLARSYILRLDFGGFVSETSGMYTCRKYASEDEVSLVWAERADVLEFGRFKFSRLQYQKRGWIKLQRVPHQGPGRQSTLTVVETHFETTPIFHKNAVDPIQQLQSFINSMRGSHSRMNNLVSDTMGNLLLEEDWKAIFAGDTSIPA